MNDLTNKNDMLQAAYALNLCTVSVSQIIDYNDLNILEQEYEAILNNLNLQNMPDDEALLNILKQLLDTITFFRISEGDKRIAERKYRQKMKNAIWNAVPNFGMIVAGGDPVTMAVSLASQIGIGYMNYRKAKAENDLEHEEQMWNLQRSAIEQFNALRRELFDTAWRLSKNHKFDDALRLTERQIGQYNTILMDADPVRRYQRLEAIQGNFEAYPPFWYYFGNAANEIARNKDICTTAEIADHYGQKAYEHFDHYWRTNSFSLLREDHIASACALELVDIMIERKEDVNRILELIDNAVKFSGNSCDILQLCGIAYLRIGNQENAYKIIKYLVNESYNVSVNVQLLSGLLISGFKETSNMMYKAEYDILSKRNGQNIYLLPWPGTQETDYMDNQRRIIIQKYCIVLDEYKEKYSQVLNRILPMPDVSKDYPDRYFSADYSDNRISEMRSIFAIRDKRTDYQLRLCSVKFSIQFIDIYNELLSNLKSWEFIDVAKIYEIAKNAIVNKQPDINRIQSRIQQQQFDIKDYIDMQYLMSPEFADPIFNEIVAQISKYVNEISDMKMISELESIVFNFCEDQSLNHPVINVNTETDKATQEETILSYELLGNEVSSEIAEMSRYNKMLDLANGVFLDLDEKSKIRFIKTNNEAFKEYFSNKKLVDLFDRENDTIAILDDRNHGSNIDLVFTTTGMAYVVKDKLEIFTTYENVKFDDEKMSLIITDVYKDEKRSYDAKKVGEKNLRTLFQFIVSLDNICSSREE